MTPTETARTLGYPVLDDAAVDIDAAATRLLPADVAAVGLAVADGILSVLVDHVPAAAEILALEQVSGCQVTVTVADPAVYTTVRSRAHRPDLVPATVALLGSLPAHTTTVVLRPGLPATAGTRTTAEAIPGAPALSGDDVAHLRTWLIGDAEHAVITWAGRRWRVSTGYSHGQPTVTLRATGTPGDAPTSLSALSLPSSLSELADTRRGLILVASAPHDGRSTTLAALTDRIATTRPTWITRIVDVDEPDLPTRRAHLTTRVVGVDTPSAAAAIAAALRDATQVITLDVTGLTAADVDAAHRAALAGLLVIATVPAGTVADALVAWTHPVPDTSRPAAYTALGHTYAAAAAQQLLPTPDGRGVVPAVEVWWRTPTLAAALSAGDWAGLQAASYDTPGDGRRNTDMAAAAAALITGGRAAG